jgi:monothiol glutaredoxin
MAQDIFKTIQEQVERDSIVLYMKGTPSMPQCGFSQATVEVLRRTGRRFVAYDVLKDSALREGIKQFSNWPTIPQLYVKGEFIGGCDIVRSMHENGELEALLAGIETA